MNTYTPAQYNDILFNKLPQEVRDVVMNSDTTRALWKIGEKRKLQIDQVGIMHDMAMDVMMGIIASKNFVGELQKELGISAFDASALARDIDEEIFKPIKTTMIKLYGDGAPYKPSSSLVQFYEEEDDHKALDKDSLLKEIENPAEAQVRREEVKKVGSLGELGKTGSQEVKKNIRLEDQKEISAPAPMVELPVSGSAQKVSPVIDLPTSALPDLSASSAGISNTLDRIASLKLSKTFVMPRGGEEVEKVREEQKVGSEREERKSGSKEVKNEINPTSALPSFSTSDISKPYTPPASKSYPVDPYREPLV